jgi:hypothetical protein
MKQRLRFRRSMLNGHPGDITRAAKRVALLAHNRKLVVTSTTDGTHSPTSFHFTKPGEAVDLGNERRCSKPGNCVGAAPGTPYGQALLERFQRFLVRKYGCSAFKELFGPVNQLNCKNGRPVTLGEGTDLENAHDNHVHVVPSRLLVLPKRLREALHRAVLVSRARRAGANHVRLIFDAADKHNVSYALALALFHHESNFINQYGHDRDKRGRIIFHGKSGLVRVTPKNYLRYLEFRRATGLAQGVGLGQLTSPDIQDLADSRGGCFRVRVNVDVALEILAGHIKALGLRKGVGAYNGGRGNPQLNYADAVLAKRDAWREVLHPRG